MSYAIIGYRGGIGRGPGIYEFLATITSLEPVHLRSSSSTDFVILIGSDVTEEFR